ncbi:hypothetical protein LTS18_013880, partial [Coniosporium uncinatum]
MSTKGQVNGINPHVSKLHLKSSNHVPPPPDMSHASSGTDTTVCDQHDPTTKRQDDTKYHAPSGFRVQPAKIDVVPDSSTLKLLQTLALEDAETQSYQSGTTTISARTPLVRLKRHTYEVDALPNTVYRYTLRFGDGPDSHAWKKDMILKLIEHEGDHTAKSTAACDWHSIILSTRPMFNVDGENEKIFKFETDGKPISITVKLEKLEHFKGRDDRAKILNVLLQQRAFEGDRTLSSRD